MSKVFVLLDSENRVTRIEGGYTSDNISNIAEWTLVDEGNGERFDKCQSCYLDKTIKDENGSYNYKYVNGVIVGRTAEEKARDTLETEVSEFEKLSAQVLYTAVCTDTLI